jgi:hypothetical protein
MESFDCDEWHVINIEVIIPSASIGAPEQPPPQEQEVIRFHFLKHGPEYHPIMKEIFRPKGTFQKREKEKDGLCELFKELLLDFRL